MCQLNLYIVPKNVNKEKVLELMKEYFYYKEPECVDEENLLPELSGDYSIYTSAGMGCNCGTVQARFQDSDKNVSWETLKSDLIKAELERLEKIKEIINSEDYEERKKNAFDTLEKLNKEREKAGINEMDEIVKKSQEFFQENLLLIQSSIYVAQEQNDGSSFIIKDIEEDIKNVSRQYDNVENEFNSLKEFASEILKISDEVKFLSYWQDGDMPYIAYEKDKVLKDLNIEDVIYLKYNELLTISK